MRRSALLVLLLAGALILLGTQPVAGADGVDVHVSPHVAGAPATLRIDIGITPASSDRTLEVWTDSGHYARSSAWTLDGANGPRLFTVEWPDLPAGHYRVFVRLTYKDDRHVTAEDSADIMGTNTR
ncbi:MAG: hypothetical protein KGN76_10875 [Acidobacteriota bacterium]|nr:hypothetical protein [Acidobacteriota bacterium]